MKVRHARLPAQLPAHPCVSHDARQVQRIEGSIDRSSAIAISPAPTTSSMNIMSSRTPGLIVVGRHAVAARPDVRGDHLPPSAPSPWRGARASSSSSLSTPGGSLPTTVVMPARTISLRWISGVWVAKPSSPLPPSRCWCGSMKPGTHDATHSHRSTSSSRPVASSERLCACSSSFRVLCGILSDDDLPPGTCSNTARSQSLQHLGATAEGADKTGGWPFRQRRVNAELTDHQRSRGHHPINQLGPHRRTTRVTKYPKRTIIHAARQTAVTKSVASVFVQLKCVNAVGSSPGAEPHSHSRGEGFDTDREDRFQKSR